MAARIATALFRTSTTAFRALSASTLAASARRGPLMLSGSLRSGAQSIYTMSTRFAQTEASNFSFSDVLMNEIKMEKKAQRKLTPPAGYEAETDGALAILKRKFEDGTHVHILMSVSGSLSPERADDTAGEAQLESRPPFLLRLLKPSGRVLEFSCSFAEDDLLNEEELEDLEDATKEGGNQQKAAPKQKAADDEYPTFSIDSVMLKTKNTLKPTVSEPVKDQEYFSDSELMDPQIYRGLIELLIARGINAKFEKELIQFATALEHDCYVKFLSDMRELINE